MGRSLLREMFGLPPAPVNEVTVNVPDEDMPGLQRAVLAAIKAGDLPKTAVKWARSAEAQQADAEKAAKKKGKDKEAPKAEVPAQKASDPKPTTKARAKDEPVSGTAKTVASMPAVRPEPTREPSQVPVNKGRSVPATNRFARRDGDQEPFPDFGNARSAATPLEPDEPEYRSPFGHLGFGSSSWDDMPAWMRDPESMPVAGSKTASQRVPGTRDREDQPSYRGPSPTGRPWTDKDVKGMGPKRPGLLSRIFGGRKSK